MLFDNSREDLWVRDGVIQNPRTIFFEEKVTPECRVDCRGLIISPGFIDIQLNGKLFYNTYCFSVKMNGFRKCSIDQV